ncbi:MAG: hypothetical protein Kow00121_59440 [Elainellaceae cyanobacterium]
MSKTKNKTAIGVEVSKNNLRLRLPNSSIQGSKRYIALGLKDNEENQLKARIIALEIEARLSSFTTLEEVREFVNERIDNNPKKLKSTSSLNLVNLWDDYCEFKRPQLAETTFRREYRCKVLHLLEKLDPKTSLSKLPEAILELTTPASTILYLEKLQSCFDWAYETGRIDPPIVIKHRVKARPYRRDIDPFSQAEVEAILSRFEQKKPNFSAFTRFLFLTGCRPGEAIALRWQNVTDSIICFCESFDSQYRIRKPTKTTENRHFPIYDGLKELLDAQSKETELVFPNTVGREISLNMFTTKVWKGYERYTGVMQELLEEGLVDRYRVPYAARSTFITRAIESGLSISQVAKLVGNTPKILLKHYLGDRTEADQLNKIKLY